MMSILGAIRGRRADSPPDESERLRMLRERIEHLELGLEDLQDATHRQFVQQAKRLDDLARRIDPHRLAQALSEEARRRGTT
jgi:hypothetical protein